MKKILSKVLLVICICVFCFSAYKIISILLEYQKIDQENNELREEIVVDENDPLNKKIDFKVLTTMNKNIVGWVYIPDTAIDYPILHGTDDEFYLDHNFMDQKISGGSIFLEAANNSTLEDDNSIIYGHNMNNGSMFHDIRNFIKEDVFDKHEYAYVYLPNNHVKVYSIYAYAKVSASSSFYTIGIDYAQYTKHALANAIYTREVSEKKAPLLLLSTCVNSTSDARHVLFTRLEKDIAR